MQGKEEDLHFGGCSTGRSIISYFSKLFVFKVFGFTQDWTHPFPDQFFTCFANMRCHSGTFGVEANYAADFRSAEVMGIDITHFVDCIHHGLLNVEGRKRSIIKWV